MAGSTHSIPTLVPGMYDYTNVQGSQSTSSNSSPESHMSQLSRTMLQLAQTNQVIANHQQQNHQAMVDVQKQQTDTFNALAAATKQRKKGSMTTCSQQFQGMMVVIYRIHRNPTAPSMQEAIEEDALTLQALHPERSL